MRRMIVASIAAIAALGGLSAVALSALLTPLPRANGGRLPPDSLPSAPVFPAPPAAPRLPPAAGPPGARLLQIPAGVMGRDVTARLAPCLAASGGVAPSTGLELQLEAEPGGGLRILGATALAGPANDPIVACARERLLGGRIAVGAYRAGERFRASVFPDSFAPAPAASPGAAPVRVTSLPAQRARPHVRPVLARR